jgi:hypothetical protein
MQHFSNSAPIVCLVCGMDMDCSVHVTHSLIGAFVSLPTDYPGCYTNVIAQASSSVAVKVRLSISFLHTHVYLIFLFVRHKQNNERCVPVYSSTILIHISSEPRRKLPLYTLCKLI